MPIDFSTPINKAKENLRTNEIQAFKAQIRNLSKEKITKLLDTTNRRIVNLQKIGGGYPNQLSDLMAKANSLNEENMKRKAPRNTRQQKI